MSINVVFLLHSYPLKIFGHWKFPSHFFSSCAGNFQVFLVDSSLILTDICENTQLTRDVVFNSIRKNKQNQSVT
ncbi:MAG: hypothetical protein P4L16_08360 [Chlamydiales bacterium]|nr:hypothetical protein [Chlamydiales bacterium]